MRTDGQTDGRTEMKLIGAFRYYANAPKNRNSDMQVSKLSTMWKVYGPHVKVLVQTGFCHEPVCANKNFPTTLCIAFRHNL
jgi:hypothetical protein